MRSPLRWAVVVITLAVVPGFYGSGAPVAEAAPPSMLDEASVKADYPDLSALPNDIPLPIIRQGRGCTWPVMRQFAYIRHVAKCASPFGTGEPTNPWRSIGEAFAGLQPGEVAYVHGGTYEETSTAQAARAGVDAFGDQHRFM
jgi:hypothetical protein